MNPKQGGPPAANRRSLKKDETASHIVTLHLYQDGQSPDAIAKERGLALSTVQRHLIRCGEEGYDLDWDRLVRKPYETVILEHAALSEDGKIKPIKEALPDEVAYFDIQVVLMKHKKWKKKDG